MQPRVIFIGRLIENRVFAPALAGVRRYAQASGWEVETVDWDEALTGTPRTLRVPPRPLGFIVEGSDQLPDLPLRLYGNAPVVFCNCSRAPCGARFARLLLDETAVARSAFRELSSSLPPACAVVGYWRGRHNWSDDRMASFRAAAAEAGLPCHSFDFHDPCKEDASGEPARLAAWLSSLPRHSAVFAVNDETAAVVVKAACIAHLGIPRDLTLLGADNDTSICEASHPTLSSIQMDFESAGFLAARLLAARMAGAVRTANDGALRANDGGALRQMTNDGDSNRSSLPPKAACHCTEGARHCAALPRPSLADGGAATVGLAVAIGPLLTVRRESTRGTGRREPRILEAIEIIRQKACDGLTAEALAARFPGSRRLFEMRFREAMGHSVLDEIQHVRMQKVYTLLASTDTPVGVIADFCGFGSDRALRKFFRSREGMSMTEWRRLHHR